MFEYMENLFTKHMDSENVYHLVIKDILNTNVKLAFSYSEHKKTLLAGEFITKS